MTKVRKIVCLIFVLSLCLSTVVSAASDSASAGIYITISGGSNQSTQNPNLLSTTTWIKKNPDNARLRNDVELSDGTRIYSKEMKYSEYGVTLFNKNFALYQTVDNTPVYAYVAHNVLQGTQSPVGYVCNTKVPITIN